jgi:hypothetical protein
MGTLFVDKLDPQSGTALEIGSSGDTMTVPSGATLAIASGATVTNSGTATGFGEANTPAFSARANGNQAVSDSTATKVNFGTEDFDTNSAFASDKFTVPSGHAGKYFFTSNLVSSSQDGVSTMRTVQIYIYKNGSYLNSMGTYTDNRNNYLDSDEVSYAFALDLAVSDYIEIYVQVISSSGGGGNLQGNKCIFTGFKLAS